MLVKDVMTREPVTVRVDTPVKEAATILSERQITALPVVDGTGRLRGVVSEADLLRDAFTRDPRSHLIPDSGEIRDRAKAVADVMTPHAITVHESTDAADAAELMTSTSIKSLPVVDERGHLVGIISRSDLIAVRARADEVIEREVDSLLVSLGHTDWLVEVSDGTVEIEGPETPRDRSIAEVAAASVAGVLAVKVR